MSAAPHVGDQSISRSQPASWRAGAPFGVVEPAPPRDAVRLFEHGRGRVEADDTLDAFRQRASHSSGATREVGRSVVRLRLRCIDDERDDIFGVEFSSGGEATCLPAETGLGSRVRARLCFRGSLDVPFPEGV
jgi:hypothetical protein